VKDVTPPLGRPLIQTQNDSTVSVSESISPIQAPNSPSPDEEVGKIPEIVESGDSDWRNSVHTSTQGDISTYLKPNYSTEKLLSMNVGNERSEIENV
jgi:hypothetical protein